MKTKVYIAARYCRRDEAAKVAQRLRDSGLFTIVSTWHDGEKDKADNDDQLQAVAVKDMEEVKSANLVLTLSDEPGGLYQYGSHHIEFGIAYALGKQCIIVGPKELMFHRLPHVLQFDTLDRFLWDCGQRYLLSEDMLEDMDDWIN